MVYEIRTEIGIDAPPSHIWDVLADFPHYPDWNPFILEVRGSVQPGATIRYRFEFPRGIRILTTAEILRFEKEKELRWTAHFLTPSVFNGEHYFLIERREGGGAVFYHGEIFSGLLLPVIRPILRKYGPQIYQALNCALRQRVDTVFGRYSSSGT
jgi:hypothetical protein